MLDGLSYSASIVILTLIIIWNTLIEFERSGNHSMSIHSIAVGEFSHDTKPTVAAVINKNLEHQKLPKCRSQQKRDIIRVSNYHFSPIKRFSQKFKLIN